ncbi:hypothetical protein F4604DRAFT_1930949 [Suillus subluteus]|nr:hypothetical protein F4604DRAFT_1930949 [Suillus subluteus]
MDTTVNFVCESLSSNESKQNPQSTTEGHEVSKRPVPPPRRPFRVYRAPGQAKAKEAKEHPPPPSHEVLYPLPPFRQTPGPIQASQTYLRTLVLERWDAEIRRCHEACKVQLLERMQGPATHQAFMWEQIAGRWNAEKKWCEEARKVQLLELLLAAHGISTLVNQGQRSEKTLMDDDGTKANNKGKEEKKIVKWMTMVGTKANEKRKEKKVVKWMTTVGTKAEKWRKEEKKIVKWMTTVGTKAEKWIERQEPRPRNV